MRKITNTSEHIETEKQTKGQTERKFKKEAIKED